MPLLDHGTELRGVAPGDGQYEATYRWLHLETGKTGETKQRFVSRRHFLELLDLWNQDARWKYWGKPS